MPTSFMPRLSSSGFREESDKASYENNHENNGKIFNQAHPRLNTAYVNITSKLRWTTLSHLDSSNKSIDLPAVSDKLIGVQIQCQFSFSFFLIGAFSATLRYKFRLSLLFWSVSDVHTLRSVRQKKAFKYAQKWLHCSSQFLSFVQLKDYSLTCGHSKYNPSKVSFFSD